MDYSARTHTGSRFLVTVASFVVICAGLRAASAMVVPFLLSAFLAGICAIPMGWLRRRGVPAAVAVLIVVLGFLVVCSVVGGLLGSSLDGFFKALPGYQRRLQQEVGNLIRWLATTYSVEVSNKTVLDLFDPAAAMRFVGGLFSAMTGLLTNAFMILVTMVFILLEITEFPERLRRVAADPDTSARYLDEFSQNLDRYLAIKTALSLLTAFVVGGWLVFLGVDFPFLWGLFAFLLNYIPNLGPIFASIPPLLVALIQLGGAQAIAVAVGYSVVNVVIGNFLEPRYMGEGLGLSTLVVFVSLTFWGWLLGPVGMLLSVPLTMTMKIALESSEDLRWIAVFLGPARVAQRPRNGGNPVESAPPAESGSPAEGVPTSAAKSQET